MSKKHPTDRPAAERFMSEEGGQNADFEMSRGLSRLMSIFKRGRPDLEASQSLSIRIERPALAQLRNFHSPPHYVPFEQPKAELTPDSQKPKIFRRRKRFQQTKQKIYTEARDSSRENQAPPAINPPRLQLEQKPKQPRRTMSRVRIIKEVAEQRSIDLENKKHTERRTKQEVVISRSKLEEVRDKRVTEGYIPNMSLIRNQVRKVENCYYSQTIKGRAGKQNQDSLVVYPGTYIVCDGHGQNGKQVSQFVSVKLLKYIVAYRERQKMSRNLLINAFERTQQDLESSGIDVELSGSTALVVACTPDTIYCANVGDSRAILCRAGNVVELSHDHKPDRNTERDRICRMGGIVRRVQIEAGTQVGPMRLWNPEGTSPGLAVSRSYGDRIASMYGVTCQPEIKEFSATNQDQFVILGSDGFFQFFDTADIVKFVKYLRKNRTDEKVICEMLAQQAKSRWGVCNGTDDISCILAFM